MMKMIKAPNDINDRFWESTTVFLAGSIEMGKAVDWQMQMAEEFSNYKDIELTFFNPRRDDFDKNAKQVIEDEYFCKQVEWELSALEEAQHVFMYLQPGTSSPVSLLELGLYAKSLDKLIVCCPNGFYRQGNVEIVCVRYNVPFYRDINEAKKVLREMIDRDQEAIKRTKAND